MKKILSVFFVAILALSLLAGCSTGKKGPNTAVDGKKVKIELDGSTSVTPLAEALGKAYEAKNANVQVNVNGSGSAAGITAITNGTCDIGMSSRALKAEETGLTEHKIALDGIAVVVNPSNTIKNLTIDQITKIFKGEITSWKDVGGVDEKIILVSREEGSGSRDAFEELAKLVGSDKRSLVAKDALIANSTGAVQQNVSSKKNGIGYISLGAVNEAVKAVSIEGVEATDANIVAGKYKISRPFLLLTKDPSAEALAFIDFVMSDEGQKIVVDNKFISGK